MSERKVFVSRPSTRNEAQEDFLKQLDDRMVRRDLRPVSLGQTDYPNRTPIQGVRQLMEQCEGAMIVGLEQIHLREGVQKPRTEQETELNDLSLPTPWNQIEAGMAFMLELPMLIIREEGVEGGVFDVGSSERYIHQATLSEEWIESPEFTQPFNSWHEEIVQES